MFSTLISAFLASTLHVISGPDHLAAVTPFAISSQRKGWKIGLLWGVGHLLGMLIIGGLFWSFRELIPVDSISKYSEQLVAFVLIGVGLWTFFRIFIEQKNLIQKHNSHNEKTNSTYISSELKPIEENIERNIWSSLAIGFLHGLAGVAHFILLLPILAFETKLQGLEYIIGFAIGTVIAMTLYALILGNISFYSKKSNDPKIFKAIRFLGGLFALLIGVYWLYVTF